MNENIDLTKILANCPEGTKLYSPALGEVAFAAINNYDSSYPIIVETEGGTFGFTKQGKLYDIKQSECLLFPSKDQRDWSKFTAPWYKKEKFDPKTLQPFDKVLVRDSNDDIWECGLFSHIREHKSFPYKCVGNSFVYCIPYNNETKHLVGTDDKAPEYYEYWED